MNSLLLIPVCYTLMLLSACQHAPAPVAGSSQALTSSAPPLSIRGEYYTDSTGRYLLNCADGVLYQVQNKSADLDARYEQQRGMAPIPGEAVSILCTGQIAATSEGGTAPVFTLQRVDSMSVRNRFNTCSAFAFWASGTEPFWSLEISTLRKALIFKDIGKESGKIFALKKLTQTNDAWTYYAYDAAGNAAVEVIIKKEPCSDGMSDMQFNYACTLSIGEEKYKGCAVKWGEIVRGE
jgi:uncharacterized membrane protein